MKMKQWDNPNKMHFESDYKTFNNQTNIISTGNVFATTQTSLCIRPYNEIQNGAYTGKPGDFLRYDLRTFDRYHIPQRIRNILEDKNRQETYWLYNFHVWEHGQPKTIGWIVTGYNHNLIDWQVVYDYRSNYEKRKSAIRECMEYVCA